MGLQGEIFDGWDKRFFKRLVRTYGAAFATRGSVRQPGGHSGLKVFERAVSALTEIASDSPVGPKLRCIRPALWKTRTAGIPCPWAALRPFENGPIAHPRLRYTTAISSVHARALVRSTHSPRLKATSPST
jgi:hypothetical protein